MSLSKKQQKFTYAIGQLIEYAHSHGYGLTFGDAYAGGKHGHMKNSNHYVRLAVDFNLFVDGEYVQDSKHSAWRILHGYFEGLGGAKMIESDANHFSFEHNGII